MPQAPLQGLTTARGLLDSASRPRQQQQPTTRSLARGGFVSPICLVWLQRYSCTITAYKPHPLLQHSACPLVHDCDEHPKDRLGFERKKKRKSIGLILWPLLP